jgi:hypothetical protein
MAHQTRRFVAHGIGCGREVPPGGWGQRSVGYADVNLCVHPPGGFILSIVGARPAGHAVCNSAYPERSGPDWRGLRMAKIKEWESPVTTPPALSGASTPEPSFLDSLQPSGPPKTRRTWLIVLIIVLALVLVGIVGCVAIIGSAKAINEGVTGASADASASQPAEDDGNAAREVKPGKVFTVGSHKTLAGWKVTQDTSLGDALFSVTGKVKNVSDATSTAFIHFTLIDSSGEVLGNVQCNSADLEPGQTQSLNCIPDGKYGKYQKVTAEATF